MRPKKKRWVRCAPGERCFRPRCAPGKKIEGVNITLDEFEALRLADLEGCEQDKIAGLMKVHRSTVSRILSAARKKVAEALVNLKAIKIEGGCCEIKTPNKKRK